MGDRLHANPKADPLSRLFLKGIEIAPNILPIRLLYALTRSLQSQAQTVHWIIPMYGTALILRSFAPALAIASLAGGPVVSAAHAKSSDRASRQLLKRIYQSQKTRPGQTMASLPISEKPSESHSERILSCLVAPHAAKPADNDLSTIETVFGGSAPASYPPHPAVSVSVLSQIERIVDRRLVPFDATAPPIC